MHAKQMQALDVVPRIAAEFEQRSGGARAACSARTRASRPRRSSSRSARCSARSTRSSTSCARKESTSASLGIRCFRPVPARRDPQALSGARRVVVLEKAFAVGIGGIVGQNVRLALSGLPVPVYDVVAGLGGRPITKRSLRTLLADVLEERLEPPSAHLPRPRPGARRARARAVSPRAAARARTPRTSCATSASSRGVALRRRRWPRRSSSSTSSEPSRSATGCSTPTSEPVQVADRALEHAHLGSPRLPGLRRGARRAVRPRRGDAGDGGRLIAANATGCLEVFSTPYPESSWQLPWLHSLFGNAPAVATGIASRAEGQGSHRRPRGRAGRRRRDARHRLRLPLGHVRAERRRALRLLRQRGVHEHGRAALERDAARGAHREHEAGRRRAGERLRPGQERAAHRDGARDPVRRDRDRRRPPRPRAQGRARDGAPRRALRPRPRPLPARLGLRVEGHDQDRAARAGDRPLPRARGRARRGRERVEDPPPRPGRGVPAPAAALRAPLRRAAPDRRHRADPGDRRPQHPPLRPPGGERDGEALRDHARRRLEPRQQDGQLADRAPGLRPPAAAVRERLPGRRERPAVALRRRGGRRRLRARLAPDHGGQPVPGRDGPGLLPPVRDRLQPCAARRGGRDQLRRAVPRRRGDRERLAGRGRGAALRQARPRRRRRPVGALRRLPPRPPRPRRDDLRRRPAAGRDDALRHPAVPAAARGPRRRDPAHRRPRRHARARTAR